MHSRFLDTFLLGYALLNASRRDAKDFNAKLYPRKNTFSACEYIMTAPAHFPWNWSRNWSSGLAITMTIITMSRGRLGESITRGWICLWLHFVPQYVIVAGLRSIVREILVTASWKPWSFKTEAIPVRILAGMKPFFFFPVLDYMLLPSLMSKLMLLRRLVQPIQLRPLVELIFLRSLVQPKFLRSLVENSHLILLSTHEIVFCL